ncbi:MAG: sigma-70 family RNA polymerase sigma factor [bacterium]|nr:sigma-70 family RNA polymerase sigma factor [bacterium]
MEPKRDELKRDGLNGDDARPGTGRTADDGQERVASAIEDFRKGIDREKNFRLLFDSYYCLVHRFFTRRVSSPEDRLDLTQEVFLRVYRGLEGYRGEAQFGTWLFRIAHNTYLKWLRRAELEETSQAAFPRPVPSRGGGQQEQASWNDELLAGVTEETPLDEILRTERLQKLHEAIAELPEQMRCCTELRIYQDLSYREISVVMGRSIDTVKVHLFQARKKLQQRLRESFEDIDF